MYRLLVKSAFTNRFSFSTGYPMKNVWSDHQSASMDDMLLKERHFEAIYFPYCPDDPNDKQQQQPQQIQPQLFICSLCGREYTWMYSLRRHQLQCGNKEARNKCQFCSRKFYRRDRLKEHVLSHHSNMI
ncbi:uncharacterized protein LOC117606856 [Osmia lignaria lignaria]|uniref:uncharacterized protein LOC117606856 n=1 Tax=Osmia lignaria lignaria TaxID=1437193 RepID=UPI0014791A54|nr:zinc finger protein ztf-16-like [Osmia lignaria]